MTVGYASNTKGYYSTQSESSSLSYASTQRGYYSTPTNYISSTPSSRGYGSKAKGPPTITYGGANDEPTSSGAGNSGYYN